MKAESVLDILSDGAAFQTAVAPKVDGADSSITFERGGAAVHSPACRTTGMNLVLVGKGGVLRPQGLLLSHVATVTIPNQTDVVSNSAIFIYLHSLAIT